MITGESWQQIRLTNSSLTINIGSFYALSVIGESIIFFDSYEDNYDSSK